MGRSTGLVFAHFPDKESLWRAAMGTPPPVDSALTRAAPALLEALEALVDAHADTESDQDGLWREAQRAIEAARGANPGDGASSVMRPNDFPSKRLSRFGAHVAAEVESRRDLPRWKEVMDPVFELCGLLVAYKEHKNSEADVYEAAVSACATLTQVGVHGAADVPYRSVGSVEREHRTEDPQRPALRARAAGR